MPKAHRLLKIEVVMFIPKFEKTEVRFVSFETDGTRKACRVFDRFWSNISVTRYIPGRARSSVPMFNLGGGGEGPTAAFGERMIGLAIIWEIGRRKGVFAKKQCDLSLFALIRTRSEDVFMFFPLTNARMELTRRNVLVRTYEYE